MLRDVHGVRTMGEVVISASVSWAGQGWERCQMTPKANRGRKVAKDAGKRWRFCRGRGRGDVMSTLRRGRCVCFVRRCSTYSDKWLVVLARRRARRLDVDWGKVGWWYAEGFLGHSVLYVVR